MGSLAGSVVYVSLSRYKLCFHLMYSFSFCQMADTVIGQTGVTVTGPVEEALRCEPEFATTPCPLVAERCVIR